MKTQISKIQKLRKKSFIEVWMLIGSSELQFTFNLKVDKCANYHRQVITYQRSFGEIFRFNQHIVDKVINLVWMFYQNESIKLPASIGDFDTSKYALISQKPFEFEIEI